MASRAHLYRNVTDSAGNVLPNVQVAVYKAGSTQLIDQTLYTQNVGSITLTNPFVTSTGVVDFYLDEPQSVKITIIQGTTQNSIDNIEVTPPPENLVQATASFVITGDPITGQFLQATGPGVAGWVSADDLISTKPSQLITLRSYDFSGSSLGDLTAQNPASQNVTPTYVDVSGDTKPAGYTFTKALRVPTATPVVVRLPSLSFPEYGTMTFLYKVIGASNGVGVATARASVDSGLVQLPLPTNDPALLNTWNVAYLGDVPSGSHSLRIEQIPGSDTASYVLLGPILVQAGNNIPFHTHGGAGIGSTVLGVDATANYARGTVVGGGAHADDVDATVYGFTAQANKQGTAIGAYADSADRGVALGYYATAAVDGVGLGYQAQSQAAQGTAVGALATASGARGTALGAAAQATAADSVAVGYSADALAAGSVALGANASVASGHTDSVAIGSGAATTAANQIMLGTTDDTVSIAGTLQASGAAIIGGAASTVGFFGASGTVRPTVTGSRAGNTSLAALLTALDAMGLIDDASTA